MAKILIGIPSGPSIPISLFLSYTEAVRVRRGNKTHFYNHRGTNTVTARNACVQKMLDEDFTHLFFMDSDMVFPKKCLQKLLDRDKNIIGGFYVRKRKGFLPNAFLKGFKQVGRWMTEWVTDLKEVEAIATGCLLIKREVFEKIKCPWFEYKWSGDDDGHMTTEDLVFCEKAKKLGFEIWCDGTVRAGHVGQFIIWPQVESGKNRVEPI